MKKYIVIMLIALISLSTTSKAQNNQSIQWVTFKKEIPLTTQDFISVFNTSDALQGKACQVAGTNIVYIYNIRPSVARAVFISNLVEMGFPVTTDNVEDFILNHCYVAYWPTGKSSYKTANYFINAKGNPVANGYTYNGGTDVWGLWNKEYNIPVSKVNCMQVQASQFRVPKQTTGGTQYVQATNVDQHPAPSYTPAPDKKTTNIEYHNNSSTKAGWSFGISGMGGSSQYCGFPGGGSDGFGGGSIFISRTPASESQTDLSVNTTGQDNNLNFLSAGLPNNSNNNYSNNYGNVYQSGCGTGSVTVDITQPRYLPWR